MLLLSEAVGVIALDALIAEKSEEKKSPPPALTFRIPPPMSFTEAVLINKGLRTTIEPVSRSY